MSGNFQKKMELLIVKTLHQRTKRCSLHILLSHLKVKYFQPLLRRMMKLLWLIKLYSLRLQKWQQLRKRCYKRKERLKPLRLLLISVLKTNLSLADQLKR
jgi:hypothetical protein